MAVMFPDVVMKTSDGKQIAFSSAMEEKSAVFFITEYYANICSIEIGYGSESIAIKGRIKLNSSA
jgi:hypothetical protein